SDADTTDHVAVALDHVTVSLDGHLKTDGVGGLTETNLLSYFTVSSGDILNGTANHAQFDWEFNSGSQAFDFLAAGQTLTLQYTIVPSDGHAATGTGNGVVTITIAGSNDAPVIDVGTMAVTQNGNVVTVNGLSVTDADANETFTVGATT
ncbi:VCBS domain-containing protein, partial [Xanthomonas citri pv. citri]